MKLNVNRSFNCKNEELPVVCGFSAISLARDLGDFTAFSPIFNEDYLAAYKAKIEVVAELVQPLTETLELKVITERIYQTLDDLIAPINYLSGYLKLAGSDVPVSADDFGLVKLRKSTRSRDVENVLMLLRTVDENIQKYRAELMTKGLSDELIAKFADARTSLSEAKNSRFALFSNRTAIVQNNQGLLSDLYDQMIEICRIGKILYKQNNPAKLIDYTFSRMMNQVRMSAKPSVAIKRVAVTN